MIYLSNIQRDLNTTISKADLIIIIYKSMSPTHTVWQNHIVCSTQMVYLPTDHKWDFNTFPKHSIQGHHIHHTALILENQE